MHASGFWKHQGWPEQVPDTEGFRAGSGSGSEVLALWRHLVSTRERTRESLTSNARHTELAASHCAFVLWCWHSGQSFLSQHFTGLHHHLSSGYLFFGLLFFLVTLISVSQSTNFKLYCFSLPCICFLLMKFCFYICNVVASTSFCSICYSFSVSYGRSFLNWFWAFLLL